MSILETLAIDPSGSFIFQTAQGYNGGTQGGIFVYAINRSNGSLGKAVGSYMTGQTLYADVVDNKGKFLYALGSKGLTPSAFNRQRALTPVPGSPFAAAGASSAGYPQPATLMAGRPDQSVLICVDQRGHFRIHDRSDHRRVDRDCRIAIRRRRHRNRGRS